MAAKKGRRPVSHPNPQPEPASREKLIDALVGTLTPEQQADIVRKAIAAQLGEEPMSRLLGLGSKPVSKYVPTTARDPKNYLGDIVDVTIVSVDPHRANAARIILRDSKGVSYLWDATSRQGLALKAGDKRRITATVMGKEGGHVHISRVRFYEKGAAKPVRFSR